MDEKPLDKRIGRRRRDEYRKEKKTEYRKMKGKEEESEFEKKKWMN